MDEDPAVGNSDLFSHLGNSTEFLLDEAADRDGFIAEVDFEEVVDLADFGPTMNKDMVFP